MANESFEETKTAAESRPLFSDFAVPSYEDWRKLIDKMLKGAPFEKKLVTQTYEDIDLQPLYRQEDTENLNHLNALPGFTPYVRGTDPLGYVGKAWDVAQELVDGTPEAFNKALRADLERGQNAVNVVLDRATRWGMDADQAEAGDVGQCGVSISTLDDLSRALAGVDLEQTPIFIQASTAALPMTAFLVALVRQQGKSAAKLHGCMGMDPLGALAREGTLPRPPEGAYDGMAKLTAWAINNTPRLQTIAVQGHPYHDGGGSATQELAYALATAVAYLRAMQNRGLTIDDVAPRIRFSFSLGSNVFMEIARLRAARMLWGKIVKAFGGDEQAQKMTIHARTSTWNKTVYDPYVNMLRTTTEAFAGVVGGCNSLHVAPFDEVIRAPDEFSRRIARNTHTILREECNIPRTVDPAGGSWYVETLTDAVAKKGWELFQAVESQGGMYQALKQSYPQQQVAEVASKRAADAARRKLVFVGTNMYANLKEIRLDAPVIDIQALQKERSAQLEQHRAAVDAERHRRALEQLAQAGNNLIEAAIEAASSGATLGEIAQTLRAGDGAKPTFKPVCIHRGAQPFEQLRLAADTFATRTGSRPKVFLASMGPLSQHKARSDFSRGFLELGGFEVLGGDGFASVEDAAKAALASQAPAVVICSTDNTYPELVPPLTRLIKDTKPEITVLLAGYPADQIDSFKAAGVDDFIYLGANCLDILLNLQKKMGVTS